MLHYRFLPFKSPALSQNQAYLLLYLCIIVSYVNRPFFLVWLEMRWRTRGEKLEVLDGGPEPFS